MKYIVTSVSNGELIITEKSNHIRSNGKEIIYVNKSVLNRLRNEGSGNVVGNLRDTDYMDIENYGSGNIDLDVSADMHVYIANEGSGNI